MKNIKSYIAEFVGTCVLVAFACGVAVLLPNSVLDGNYTSWVIATALAFGLVIVAMAYSIGNVSGCHINPAVSISMLVVGKMKAKDFLGYIIAQVLGAIAGAALVGLFAGSFINLGGNVAQEVLVEAYGDVGSLFVALVVEIILTFVFVTAIHGVTSKTENKAVAGVVIGLTLTLVHLIGIPLTGTSVNPARSFGPALLQMIGGNFEAIKQIWIFIVGPLLGGVAAAFFCKFLFTKTKGEILPAEKQENLK